MQWAGSRHLCELPKLSRNSSSPGSGPFLAGPLLSAQASHWPSCHPHPPVPFPLTSLRAKTQRGTEGKGLPTGCWAPRDWGVGERAVLGCLTPSSGLSPTLGEASKLGSDHIGTGMCWQEVGRKPGPTQPRPSPRLSSLWPFSPIPAAAQGLATPSAEAWELDKGQCFSPDWKPPWARSSSSRPTEQQTGCPAGLTPDLGAGQAPLPALRSQLSWSSFPLSSTHPGFPPGRFSAGSDGVARRREFSWSLGPQAQVGGRRPGVTGGPPLNGRDTVAQTDLAKGLLPHTGAQRGRIDATHRGAMSLDIALSTPCLTLLPLPEHRAPAHTHAFVIGKRLAPCRSQPRALLPTTSEFPVLLGHHCPG